MSVKFPATPAELKEDGLMFLNQAFCRYCGDPVEKWKTRGGREIPLSITPKSLDRRELHWTKCPASRE